MNGLGTIEESDLEQLHISDTQHLQLYFDTVVINYTNQYVEDPVVNNTTIIPQEQSVAQPINISLVIADFLSEPLDFELPLLSCLNEDITITIKNAPQIFDAPSDSTGLWVTPSPQIDLGLPDKTNSSLSPVHDLGDGYLPISQSTCGLLCYHERLRSYLRNSVLSSLPEPWAKWITNNVSG